MRSCEGLAVIWTGKLEFFFLTSPKVAPKNQLDFGEDLFFWRSPEFGRKNRLNLIKARLKSGSKSFNVFSSFQNSPPVQIPGYAPEDMEA